MLATGRRRRANAGALAFLLLFLAPFASAFEWDVDITPAGELFPVLDLTQRPRAIDTATGRGTGLVAVRVRGALPQALRVTVRTPGLREAAEIAWTRARGDHAGRLDLHPYLDWDVAALRAIRGVREQDLVVTMEADGHTQTRTMRVRVHALDDAPYFVREGKERVDLGWAFAGYVNPRDPVVDEVLALARQIDPAFRAEVDPADPDRNLHRVATIWAALERRGMRYDDGDPALSRGPVVWSQRVRLPDEVWHDRRANCIDGSVLIAAVLERIGLDALIVLVPGHAFVGYRTGDGAAEYFETTVLGARGTRGRDNFAAARAAGRASFRRAAPRLDGRHGPDHALIDIDKARRLGIRPLPTMCTVGRRCAGPA